MATYAHAVAGTYQQFCAVAAALDVVGDRWTLLVVRELLAGPRRYGELMLGLPGVATNLLADRLRRLEVAGLVDQEPGSDARTRVYRLTERGAELDGEWSARWRASGSGCSPTRRSGLAFRADWLATAVRFLLRPGALDAGPRGAVRGDGAPMVRRFCSSAWARRARRSIPTVVPEVVLAGDPAALVTALRDPARARVLTEDGRLAGDGERRGPGAAHRRARVDLE